MASQTTTKSIKIYSPNGNGPSDVIFSTQYPYAKLDTQHGIDLTKNPPTNPTSFQNISIFFNSNPPYDPLFPVVTQIYQFAHGYDFVPTYWVLYQNVGASNTVGGFAYGNENSIILGTTPFSFAELLLNVDNQNVTFFVQQIYKGGDPVVNLVGVTIRIRLYIFVEPILV